MLSTRLWMGSVLVALAALGLGLDEQIAGTGPAWLPPFPCWFVMALVTVIWGSHELIELLRHAGLQVTRAIPYAAVCGIAVANWVPWIAGPDAPPGRMAWPFLAFVLGAMAMCMKEVFGYRESGAVVVRLASGLLVLFYLGVLPSFFIQLRWVHHGLLGVCVLLAAAKCGDIGAYFTGRAFGRNKLCPRLSPNKTVEGAIGGAIASVVATLGVVWAGSRLLGTSPLLGWGAAVFLGLLIGGLGQVGDLVESLIKRDSQQKDASRSVPGFGGILDVLDSPLFGAPAALVYWGWFGPGWGVGLPSFGA